MILPTGRVHFKFKEMKKVVLNTDNKVIDINQIDNYSHIGIQWDRGSKGLLMFDSRHDEAYCIESTESCRRSSVYSKGSKREYVEDAIIDQAHAFCFDSAIELYRWLSK